MKKTFVLLGLFACSSTPTLVREPAAAKDIAKVKTDSLLNLYTDYDFSDKEIRKKLEAATDALQFFRSFLPAYYDLAARAEPMPRLTEFRGMTAGDAHLENFGALIQADGSVIYSINDVDDYGVKVPVYLDFLRLPISVRLSKFKNLVSFKSITQSYIDGKDGC